MGEEKEKREAVVLSGISLYNGHVGSALEHPISGAPYFAWCFQRSILFWSNRRPFPGQGEGEPTANHGGVEGGGPAEKGCVDLAASANRGQQMRVVFSEMDGQAPRMVFFFLQRIGTSFPAWRPPPALYLPQPACTCVCPDACPAPTSVIRFAADPAVNQSGNDTQSSARGSLSSMFHLSSDADAQKGKLRKHDVPFPRASRFHPFHSAEYGTTAATDNQD